MNLEERLRDELLRLDPLAEAVCRYRSDETHICGDADGRVPPRAICVSEARAQVAEQHVADLKARGVIKENPHK